MCSGFFLFVLAKRKSTCYNTSIMKFSKTYITPIATGATNLQESKDCVIRAITNVTGVSYDEVHSFLASYGRKQGKGTDVETMFTACKAFGLKFVGTFGKTSSARSCAYFAKRQYAHDHDSSNKSITLGNLVKSLPFGRFVVVIRGHAVAMIDGKLIDTHLNPKQAQVVALFQFGDLPDSV